MRWLAVLFLTVSLLGTRGLYAKNPPPLFDRPVKVDDSGRPLYNSWEQEEYLRKFRHKRQFIPPGQMPKPHVGQGFEPSPTQPVINRPTKVNGDPKVVGDDAEFTF